MENGLSNNLRSIWAFEIRSTFFIDRRFFFILWCGLLFIVPFAFQCKYENLSLSPSIGCIFVDAKERWTNGEIEHHELQMYKAREQREEERKFSIVLLSLIDVADVIARLYLLLDGVDIFFSFSCRMYFPSSPNHWVWEKAICDPPINYVICMHK